MLPPILPTAPLAEPACQLRQFDPACPPPAPHPWIVCSEAQHHPPPLGQRGGVAQRRVDGVQAAGVGGSVVYAEPRSQHLPGDGGSTGRAGTSRRAHGQRSAAHGGQGSELRALPAPPYARCQPVGHIPGAPTHPEVVAVQMEGVLLLGGAVGAGLAAVVAVVGVGVQVLQHHVHHLALRGKGGSC